MHSNQTKGAVLVLAGLTGLTTAAWAIQRLLKKQKTYDDLDSKCSGFMLWVTNIVLNIPCLNALRHQVSTGSKPLSFHTGVVSFSARLVAGMRAYESKEVDPLFRDPLAEVLAGKPGMDGAKLTMKVCFGSPTDTYCSMQLILL